MDSVQFFKKPLFTENLWMTAPADSFYPTKVLSTDPTFSRVFFSFHFFSLLLLIITIVGICSEKV